MTDTEIIKAMEKWIKALKDDYKRLQALGAPMDCFEESHTDNIRVLSNALDLIDRKNAEISVQRKLLEKAESEIESLRGSRDRWRQIALVYDEVIKKKEMEEKQWS